MSDLIVVGAGTLGKLVARSWKAKNPSAKITLKFRSVDKERNALLELEGFNIISKEKGEEEKAPLVVFCAPPTGNENYADDIKQSLENHWDTGEKWKETGTAVFVFTSAGSVYAENSGGVVDEASETARTERSGKLLDGEKYVTESGGCVVRLGGLYSAESGAHNYWCSGNKGEMKEFPAKGNGLINLIHYEDAAEVVVRCFQNPQKVGGETFLVSDGVPISRQNIAASASTSQKYSGAGAVHFTGGDAVDGKKYNTDKVRKVLDWVPKYSSFDDYMKSSSNSDEIEETPK